MFIAFGLLALSFMIIVHEAGHYVVARWCGMKVERFSIGFGPKLWGWRNKHGTLFQICPILFGGFVEIKGMNIVEDVDPDDKTAYPNRPAWQRFVTIFAGPATNYLSAIVLAFGVYSCAGMKSYERWYGVAEVVKGAPAEGLLQPGDRVLAVDGQPFYIRGPAGEGMRMSTTFAALAGAPVSMLVARADQLVEVRVQPRLEKDEKGEPIYRIGVALTEEFDRVHDGPIAAMSAALRYPVLQTEAIIDGLRDVIRGDAKLELGGPVRIGKEFAKAAEEGAMQYLGLLMGLSVYIGLFNLFPLPALDGGRLVFLTYELITRRRANPRIESTVHLVGVMLLIVLMVGVTVNDCAGL